MNYRHAAVLSVVLAAVAPCMAQTQPSAPAAPPATAPAAAAALAGAAPAPSAAAASTAAASSSGSEPQELSPDLIKKARREGYKPEKQRDGQTLFCHKDADTGTRFETKKCVTPDQLDVVIQARQQQRDNLAQQRACSGASCSGK